MQNDKKCPPRPLRPEGQNRVGLGINVRVKRCICVCNDRVKRAMQMPWYLIYPSKRTREGYIFRSIPFADPFPIPIPFPFD